MGRIKPDTKLNSQTYAISNASWDSAAVTQGGNVLHLVAGPVTVPAWSYVLSLSTFGEFYQCSPKGFPKRYEVFLMLGFQTKVMKEMWWSWPAACNFLLWWQCNTSFCLSKCHEAAPTEGGSVKPAQCCKPPVVKTAVPVSFRRWLRSNKIVHPLAHSQIWVRCHMMSSWEPKYSIRNRNSSLHACLTPSRAISHAWLSRALRNLQMAHMQREGVIIAPFQTWESRMKFGILLLNPLGNWGGSPLPVIACPAKTQIRLHSGYESVLLA